MSNLNNLLSVERIESRFADGKELSDAGAVTKKSPLSKIRIRHLLWIPSLLFTRTYRLLPSILKDLLFWLSIIHKSPASKLFAKTGYDEFRTNIDIKISSLAIKGAPANLRKDLESAFSSGFYSVNLSNLSKLDQLINDVINYSNSSHAGARPYFKDGKNKQIENSFSAYYSFSKQDNQKINSIIEKDLNPNFDYYLSALAGYKCKLRDISYSLSIVSGANSNDEMHQDTYASVAKGFLYLQDIDSDCGPFEYLEGSYIDASFRSNVTNKAVLQNDTHSAGSTRLREDTLENGMSRYKLKSFTGPKGLFVIANTGGYHRKGSHNSNKPRILLSCGVKRKGAINKLLINLFEIIKSAFK
tara:strand:+ start:5774 stop:6847 length:1074 start_codon:yes stop_codon:yes gene_type:complete